MNALPSGSNALRLLNASPSRVQEPFDITLSKALDAFF
jgi:hypothetical protein